MKNAVNERLALPAPVRAATLIQLAVAIAVFAVEVLDICVGCETGGLRLRLVIALVGVVGYGLIALAANFGRVGILYAGLAIAAGVHVALVGWMVAEGELCLTCSAAAAGLVVLVIVALVWRSLPWRAVFRLVHVAFVPAALLAGIFAWGAARADADRKSERDIQIARGYVFSPRPAMASGDAPPLRIAVYESEHCPYCLEFREDYLPRLNREFKGQVEVRFLEARSASWVRRTPTILVEGGPVWEGLPVRYSDLRDVVAEELSHGRSQ